MSEALSRGSVALLKREKASLVAATGLIFERLKSTSQDISLQDSLVSYKGGTWGDESVEGIGYPVLRSSNMRGKRVDVIEAAWCNVTDEQAKAFSLESGDILVTKSSGSFDLVGKAALFDDPNDGNLYLFSNFTMRLRPDRKKVIPEYIAWFLRSPQALSWRFENQQTTVGLRNLQTKEYLSQVIPVPSLEIQKQVVDYLNAVETESKESIKLKLPEILEKQRHSVERVEALSACIAKAQALREKAITEINALNDSILGNLFEENKSNWTHGVISEFAEINPSRKGQVTLKGEDFVSFVPMRAVDDITGTIARAEPRPFQEVSKGYTWFQDGDVIFAKITPCMENGKSAIANNLVNGIGFGSTEFHVLRPSNKVLAEWLYILVRSKQFRDDAAAHFKGTAGQQRVPQRFLDNKVIPVPPLDEQRRIVAYLDSVQARLASLRELQSVTGEELSALLPSVLDKAFKGEL